MIDKFNEKYKKFSESFVSIFLPINIVIMIIALITCIWFSEGRAIFMVTFLLSIGLLVVKKMNQI